MYRFIFNNIENTSPYEELIKEFLQPSEYGEAGDTVLEYDFKGDREAVKRNIYADLSKATGKSPKWGVLTGIRPVKLAGEILDVDGPCGGYNLHFAFASALTAAKAIAGAPD